MTRIEVLGIMATGRDDRAALLEEAIRLKRAAKRSRATSIPPRPESEPARLGQLQRSLWLLHQMEPRSSAYNLASAFRVRGDVDIPRLQRSLDKVVARHRVLRSNYRSMGGSVVQVFDSCRSPEIRVVGATSDCLLAAATLEATAPFDLASGPLLRMLVIGGYPSDGSLLVLVAHHIIADERSLTIFWNELTAVYGGAELEPDNPAQYDDYVHWMANREPADRSLELAYWRDRLEPLPSDAILPFESPPRGAEPSGKLLRRIVAGNAQRDLRRLASGIGVTPFIVFAFTFRLLLERYLPGEHIAFGTPVSSRAHPATADMIGYFLNPVAICVPVDERLSVHEAVREFSEAVRDLFAHATVPFDLVTENLAPRRHRGRHPLFQLMFVYQAASPSLALGDARLEPVDLDLGASKFDATLFVRDARNELEIAVEYRSDRLAKPWMQQLLTHYETLLSSLAARVEGPVSEARLLTRNEEARLSWEWQGKTITPTERRLVPQQILDRANSGPDDLAVVCGGMSWSYSELATAGRSIADELAHRGVRVGDRVGVFVDRSNWMVACVLGCQLAGAAYVPLDPAYPADRTEDVLRDAAVAAVVTTTERIPHLAAGPWAIVDVLGLGAPDASHATTPRDGGGHGATTADIAPETPAYVLYTSGSTGHPKGVVVTHDNLRASTAARPPVYGGSPGRFLLIPSLAFDSSVAGIFWTLSSGGALVVPTDDEAPDPRRLARLVREQEVSSLLCVPSLYGQMLRFGGNDLVGLDKVIVAGESCPSRLVEEHFAGLPSTRLFNEYGPTEATVWATVHEMTPPDADGPVAIGRPIPGVRVLPLDALGRLVPAGIPAEAWIEGPTVAQGYWKRDDLTREKFRAAGEIREEAAFRSGDQVSWTLDGNLLFSGRTDDQIKLRGFRIEPGEIEATISEQTDVLEVAVVARPTHSGAETAAGSMNSTTTSATSDTNQLVAFIVSSKSQDVDIDRHARLSEHLPDFMVPRRYVQIEELPRLPNGKVDRDELRRIDIGNQPDHREQVAMSGQLETELASLWEGLLGQRGISRDDNFFERGGHSLLIVEMTHTIEHDYGVRLSAADVFQSPTVHQLAERIRSSVNPDTPGYAHLFPIQPGGGGAPVIVAVPHFFSGMLAERFRGERPVYGLRGPSLRPEGNLGRWRSMTELAEEAVSEIDRRFPGEACFVVGYSFGASMAFEATRLMEDREMTVRRLFMIAPMALDLFRFGPFALQIGGLREPVEELSAWSTVQMLARDNNPLTPQPYRKVWRLFAVQSWRHLLCSVGKLQKRIGLPLSHSVLHADVRIERFRLHRRYRPRSVRTPTVVFNAREPETDAAATWRPHFRGRFDVVETPDPHLGKGALDQAKEVILRHLEDLESDE